jgi:hypothetical protein
MYCSDTYNGLTIALSKGFLVEHKQRHLETSHALAHGDQLIACEEVGCSIRIRNEQVNCISVAASTGGNSTSSIESVPHLLVIMPTFTGAYILQHYRGSISIMLGLSAGLASQKAELP